MSGLRPVPYRKVARFLRSRGFVEVRQRGSHVFFEHRASGRSTVVPLHAGEDIGPGLLRKILKDAAIEPEEFLRDG